jgi:hypothetical protein
VEFGKGRKRLVATFVDDTGQMELVWFQGHKWVRESLKLNEILFLGNVRRLTVYITWRILKSNYGPNMKRALLGHASCSCP